MRQRRVIVGLVFVQVFFATLPIAAKLALREFTAPALTMLRCLAALHPVTLDGIPLAHLHYDAGSDAQTDRPALVAMIDVRSLAPGRHELAIAGSSPAGGDTASAAPWIIPFWR